MNKAEIKRAMQKSKDVCDFNCFIQFPEKFCVQNLTIQM